MINERQILRLAEAQEFPRLVDRVLANGRCPSSLVRRQLGLSEAAAPVGLGLALQRLAEITYAPSDAADVLIRQLLLLQRRDGSFACGHEPSINAVLTATAVALKGLLVSIDQRQANTLPVNPLVTLAIGHALNALVRMFGSGGSIAEHAVGWGVVAWQLGDREEFRRLIAHDRLLAAINDTLDEPLVHDLGRYARAAAA